MQSYSEEYMTNHIRQSYVTGTKKYWQTHFANARLAPELIKSLNCIKEINSEKKLQEAQPEDARIQML